MFMPILLLVDDNLTFCQVLGKAMQKRGFEVHIAHSTEQAVSVLNDIEVPDFAIVDLSMPGGASGLMLVEVLHARSETMKIVVLTGYASIATAVEAIKLGATHYLAKPAHADEIMQAFGKNIGDVDLNVAEHTLSVRRLEWEHIQKVLNDCEGNISAAARELGMHRRTLQRKLSKHPVKS